MNSNEKQELQILATKARIYALEGIFNAKSGHPGGSLSAADIYTYIYYKELNVDPANPDMPDRDKPRYTGQRPFRTLEGSLLPVALRRARYEGLLPR